MATPRWLAAPVVVATLAACGPGTANHVASTARTAAVSPTPPAPTSAPAQPGPVTGAYGVLVGSQTAASYTVTIVGVAGAEGKVVASAQSKTPTAVSCANAAAAVVPLPVSASNSRVYFMNDQAAINWLAPDGTQSDTPVFKLQAGPFERSFFAVSPDDQQIAVVVASFTSTGATTQLYVDPLSVGAPRNLIFSESGAYTLWPVGWHGTNNLVLAKVPSCTQGGGPFCCGPLELHVVDPATATRRFTLGGPTCVLAGAPSSAGVVCEDAPNFSKATVLNWTGGTVRTLPISGPTPAFLSPNGSQVAMVGTGPDSYIAETNKSLLGIHVCGWIDDVRAFSGGDVNTQSRLADTGIGWTTSIAAVGTCGGRIPGGL